MKNILLVEDSAEVQLLVKTVMEDDFNLLIVGSSQEALDIVNVKNFDIFLIDILLPGDDGFHLCARLRSVSRTRNIPIIFLTSKSEIQDKILGFSLGADDYIVKPFDPIELKIRVESKLKRHQGLKLSDEFFRRGELGLNIPSQKAYVFEKNGENELDLTPNEFRLLFCFLRNEGRVLSRNRLLDEVWGDKINVSDRTVDTHVYQLRKKLLSRAEYIESIKGEGYRFLIRAPRQ